MSGEDGDAPTIVKIPPKGRRLGTRRSTKQPPEIGPEPVFSWGRLGCVASLLLAAVAFTVLLFLWLHDEGDRPKPIARPDGSVDGEVAVVDGEVTVVDTDGNRVPPEPEPGSESER